MTVSIIIAVKTWQKNLEECVNKCLELNYPDFEIIILPDAPVKRSFKDSRIKIIPTGEVSPPLKRDIGIENASGEILAFLDDDAYPVKDWLLYASESFSDPAIAAVGGPGVTPFEDSITQKASGLIYSSFLMSGTYGYRYIPFKRTIEVDDFPSCNLLVRKSVVKEAGGFKSNYWPGEDTVLCLGITKHLHKKIMYDPRVVVYHHRRSFLIPHLKQLANYALHRGYFVKKFPETSFRPAYFVPSVFLLSIIIGGGVSVLFPPFRLIYYVGLFLYAAITAAFSLAGVLKDKYSGRNHALSFRVAGKIVLCVLVFSGIILSHLTYGLFFLIGLMKTRLQDG